ncbi:MAG: TlpA disulfide reductase family protein, partial [Myxococcaceae bacterium]
MRRLSCAVVLALGLSGAAWADDDLAAVNKPAPMFRLPVYNQKAVGSGVVGLDKFVGPDSSDKATKVVLMSFMASFCAPCKKEMPYLQSLHDKYKDFGLRVVMVSIDTEPEGQKIVDELIETNKVTFPVLKDRFNLVARRYLGTQSPLPSVFMVKPDGVVSAVHRGYDEEASLLLASEVQAALGVKVGPMPKPPEEKAPEPMAPAVK